VANRFYKKGRMKARTRTLPGQMNKTEQAYTLVLSDRADLKEIIGWRFEAVKLRLADNTFYTPDFWVQMSDGTIEIHEVKACKATGAFLCEDDAKVKIKVAAELYHEFKFFLCGRLPKNAGWRIEQVGG